MGRRTEGKRRFVMSLLPLERRVFEDANRARGMGGSVQSWALDAMMHSAARDLNQGGRGWFVVGGGCRR